MDGCVSGKKNMLENLKLSGRNGHDEHATKGNDCEEMW